MGAVHLKSSKLGKLAQNVSIPALMHNKCCMSWQGKDMGQLLVHYQGVWPIGTLPIETSPDP